jgi:transposase
VKNIQHKTTLMKTIQQNKGVEIEELLRRLFVDENKQIQEIARELNISYPIVINWLSLSGVRHRKIDME